MQIISHMKQAPRHDEMAELRTELRAFEDRAVALSLYDPVTTPNLYDLTIYTLSICDEPKRDVDPEQLQQLYTMCGKFGVLAVKDGIYSERPYLHLGNFNDTLELLQRDRLVVIGNPMRLTDTGRQIGARMIRDQIEHQRDTIRRGLPITRNSR